MSEPDDPRLRFGMDPPRLEERAHWEELVPGADERPTAVGDRLTQLIVAGDRMAEEVERRWSGPNGCDCPVCSAATAWRTIRKRDAAWGEPLTVDEDGEA